MNKKGSVLAVVLIVVGVLIFGGAAGIYAVRKFTKGPAQEAPVILISPTSTPSQSELSTKPSAPVVASTTNNLLTFRNNSFGFEFQYPRDLNAKVTDTGNSFAFYSVNSKGDFFQVNGDIEVKRPDSEKSSLGKATVGGKEALDDSSENVTSFYVPISERQSGFVRAVRISYLKTASPEIASLFEKIVASMRFYFTDADWRTYSNDAARIEFKYPPVINGKETKIESVFNARGQFFQQFGEYTITGPIVDQFNIFESQFSLPVGTKTILVNNQLIFTIFDLVAATTTQAHIFTVSPLDSQGYIFEPTLNESGIYPSIDDRGAWYKIGSFSSLNKVAKLKWADIFKIFSSQAIEGFPTVETKQNLFAYSFRYDGPEEKVVGYRIFDPNALKAYEVAIFSTFSSPFDPSMGNASGYFAERNELEAVLGRVVQTIATF